MSAILLAAGESTRMGRQKALLPWAGATLLEYQLAQLAAVRDIVEIIVVTGHEPERIREIASAAERARVVHNGDYRTGKVSSIKAGLAAVSPDAEAIMLLGVDQPRPASLLLHVVAAHCAGGSVITVPSFGSHSGHPVIFSAGLRGELSEIVEETLGVRAVLRRHADDVGTVEVADRAVLLDLNSPADLPRT